MCASQVYQFSCKESAPNLTLPLQDTENLKDFINSAKKLNDLGGDWDRRNRLKVYEAILLLMQRNIRKAAELLLDCVATFTCVEVCPYQQFMFYVVITNIMTLGRADLKKKILQSPQVLSVMRRIRWLPELLRSIFECNYAEFFVAVCPARFLSLRVLTPQDPDAGNSS
jgi:26S proteasome regulatory subunit N7